MVDIRTGRPATLAPNGMVTSPHSLASQAGVDVLRAGGSAVDAAIATMSFHWFPRKAEGTRAIARALRPGGVMAAVLPGEGVDEEFRRILATIEPPHVNFLGSFQAAPRSLRHMDAYLSGAGL